MFKETMLYPTKPMWLLVEYIKLKNIKKTYYPYLLFIEDRMFLMFKCYTRETYQVWKGIELNEESKKDFLSGGIPWKSTVKYGNWGIKVTFYKNNSVEYMTMNQKILDEDTMPRVIPCTVQFRIPKDLREKLKESDQYESILTDYYDSQLNNTHVKFKQ